MTDSHSEANARIQYERNSSSNKTLLTALHNLIIPLVQTAMPNNQNLSTEPMGPEAEQLIVALQSYISSIIRGRSQTDVSNTISRIAHFEEFDTAMNSNAPESQIEEDGEAESESVVANNIISNPDDKQTCRLGEMLDDIQENVFNDIPIRLLSFEKSDKSKSLKISLIGRAELYHRYADELSARFMSVPEPGKDRRLGLFTKVRYAILSHTWLCFTPGEVTFDDWNNGSFEGTRNISLDLDAHDDAQPTTQCPGCDS